LHPVGFHHYVCFNDGFNDHVDIERVHYVERNDEGHPTPGNRRIAGEPA
jgi:hypothetical protein